MDNKYLFICKKCSKAKSSNKQEILPEGWQHVKFSISYTIDTSGNVSSYWAYLCPACNEKYQKDRIKLDKKRTKLESAYIKKWF